MKIDWTKLDAVVRISNQYPLEFADLALPLGVANEILEFMTADEDQMASELGDVLWYRVAIAQTMAIPFMPNLVPKELNIYAIAAGIVGTVKKKMRGDKMVYHSRIAGHMVDLDYVLDKLMTQEAVDSVVEKITRRLKNNTIKGDGNR